MKDRSTFLYVLLMAGLMTGQHVFAAGTEDDKRAQLPAAEYGELVALRSQNALLTEQLKNAKLKNELDAARGISSSGSGVASKTKQSASTYFDRGARVQLVAGVGGKMTATIQFPDGGNTVARVGMRVPGLGVVKSIKTDEVIVENGKETISVPFASEPVSNATQYAAPYSSSPQGGTMVPPLSLPGRN